MRKFSLIAVLVCAPALMAQDKVGTESQGAKPAVEKQTVNKPVIDEKKVAKPVELHESATIQQMLAMNNSMRAQAGLGPHQISRELTQAAQDHANYMAATGSFSHYSNGGPQGRAMRYGHGGSVLENIAWGQMSVDQAFNTWRASGGHWANMASGTSVAGFGYAIGANGSPFWVAVYGHGPAAGAVVPQVTNNGTPAAAPVAADSAPAITSTPVQSAPVASAPVVNSVPVITGGIPANLPPGFLKPGEVIISSRIISE